MKNNIIKFVLLIILLFCITQKSESQVENLAPLSVTPVLPTYSCGQVITISYELDYTMQQGKNITMTVEYNNTQLQLISFAPQQSGLFQSVTVDQGTPLTTNTYRSLPFTDHNYTNSSYFTISFRVINCECPEVSSSVNVNAFMEQGDDEHPVSTPVSVSNQNSGASVSLELIAGSDCGTAMYKIVSVGKDAPNNSELTLTMPKGIHVTDVYNTNGSEVTFSMVSTSPDVFKWSRSNIPDEDLQIHYVIVQFDVGMLCTRPQPHSIDLAFYTHNICDNSDVTVTAVRPINCCQPPDPCPTCPPGPVSGSVIIPGDEGGTVNISKWLVKVPFRYFPKPDNCRTHDYYIKIENMTNTDLENFRMYDYLDDIAGSVNAISITDISVSLSPLIGSSTSTLDFQTHPPNSIISTIPSDGIFYSIYTPDNNGIFSHNDEFHLEAATVFPRWSTLLVKITHRLDDPAVLPPYENKAEVRFSADGQSYGSIATFTSLQDSYDPVITIDKKVKLATDPDASYESSKSINPGETVRFRIRIRNYGMADVPFVNFRDVFTNNLNNFNSIFSNSVVVTGSLEYSSTDLSTLEQIIKSELVNPTIGGGNIFVKAAPCPGFAELTIEYTVQARDHNVIQCNSVYTNSTHLKWEWPPNTNGSTGHTAEASATVNIDLFKNIMYKLEATCDTNDANSWRINSINGIPGRTIFYRATVKNNNTYPVNGLKMMVQLPYGMGTNVSTHSFPPVVLTSNPPQSPSGTGLVPLGIINNPSGGFTSDVAVNNWLGGTPPVPNISATGIQAIYNSFTLTPNGTATINYRVIVPNNIISAQYNTSMGVSLGSNNNCPSLVKNRDLVLKVATSNACYTATGCDLILFDKLIELTQSGFYHVRLYNINNMGNFNIDNMEIIVHQPYKNRIFSTTPAPTPTMVPYYIGTIATPSGYTVTQPTSGQRYYTVTNLGSGNFGSIDFSIHNAGPLLGGNEYIVFPINVVFKDNNNKCTICEKTFYLTLYPPPNSTFILYEDQ